MKVGITATREGMNKRQLKAFSEFLSALPVGEFHHGDCVGGDVQAAKIASALGWRTVSHPPENQSLRAFHKSDVIMPPLGYLARNRKIVAHVGLLAVGPKENSPRQNGGTWYTYRHSVGVGTPTKIFYPDGRII